MEFLTLLLADWLMFLLAGVAVFGILIFTPRKERWKKYLRVFFAGLTSIGLAKIASLFYQPNTQRPFELLDVEAGASYLNNPGFPSDHALFAMFLALAFWFCIRNVKASIILVILAVLISVGRVMALVHTPLDVIFGSLFAIISALLWYRQK